jgi:outer membrane protein assembly factor BamD
MLAGCGWFSKDLDEETKGWSAQKFYLEASSALKAGDYEQAIEYYEGLEARYPFGRYAMQAQLDIAYAYYLYDEPDSAIAAADRFIRLHPRSAYVDYAYYLKGIVNFKRSLGFFDRFLPTDPSQRDPGSALSSFKDFSELVRRFPDSKYAEDAQKRLIYLRNNLARYEIHVAGYYMDRKAYLAAANRGVYVVEKFERTPAVKPALEVMIEAYTKLGLDDLASDAQRVLALNEAKGTFDDLEPPEEERSLGRKIWDYLELDEN